MAIIQSILVGKGKGKIGNVVLSGLKGQTVAKQLNSSPSNPRTVAQTANRVKMANAVLAWQFLANFMSNAKGIRKPLESVYNAFIRTVVNGMKTVLEGSRALAAQYALDLGKLVGNWFNITIDNIVAGSLTISLSNSGIVWSPSMYVRAIIFDAIDGGQVVIDRAVTSAEFESGTLTLVVSETSVGTMSAAYIYDSVGSKVTNIAYLEI